MYKSSKHNTKMWNQVPTSTPTDYEINKFINIPMVTND